MLVLGATWRPDRRWFTILNLSWMVVWSSSHQHGRHSGNYKPWHSSKPSVASVLKKSGCGGRLGRHGALSPSWRGKDQPRSTENNQDPSICVHQKTQLLRAKQPRAAKEVHFHVAFPLPDTNRSTSSHPRPIGRRVAGKQPLHPVFANLATATATAIKEPSVIGLTGRRWVKKIAEFSRLILSIISYILQLDNLTVSCSLYDNLDSYLHFAAPPTGPGCESTLGCESRSPQKTFSAPVKLFLGFHLDGETKSKTNLYTVI